LLYPLSHRQLNTLKKFNTIICLKGEYKNLKKVGIITLNGYHNYGNRLQNYALQEVLKKLNFEVETIWIDNIRLRSKNKSILRKLTDTIFKPKLIFKKVHYELFLKGDSLRRKNRFEEFSEKYIKETNYTITEENLTNDKLKNFDFFVTGSDQVWNPYFTKGSPIYFLTFAPKEKRIAYAPSFAITEIPKKYESDFKKWLTEMKSLSVREEAGARIIEKLTNRKSEVVADPTLLLTKKEWLQIATPPLNKPKKKYLLTYYLGEITSEVKSLILYCEKKLNLEVVNLANKKEKEYYLTDPAEFLDLINSASLFITDSFHATVFSILFETPFVVTDRAGSLPSMNSRITTLLSTFDMENRHINQVDKKGLLEIEFSNVDPILESLRNKSFLYLNKALSNK